MEQIIEEYGISALLLLVGTGILMAFGEVFSLLAGV